MLGRWEIFNVSESVRRGVAGYLSHRRWFVYIMYTYIVNIMFITFEIILSLGCVTVILYKK